MTGIHEPWAAALPAANRVRDLRKLRHVVQVARSGSFTGASTVLAITQSALTKSVAEIENALGLKLFHRLPRGVQLTEAGEIFVPRAERILNDTADLVETLNALQNLSAGHLRIGVSPPAYISFLESTVSAFAKVYPGINIEVVAGSLEEMAQAAFSGRIDLVVGATNFLADQSELNTQRVVKLHGYMIARSEHPLTVIDSPDAAQVLSYPVILPTGGAATRAHLVRAYEHAGLPPVPEQYSCDHFALVRKLVEATDAISPVVSVAPPGASMRSQFAVFEDVLDLDEAELGFAQAKGRTASAATAAFKDIFASFLQDAEI